MLVFNVYYLDLLGYCILLCSFIPAWIFMVLGYQLLMGSGIASLNNECNTLEFAWTVLPTLSVAFLCWFNVFSSGFPMIPRSLDAVLIIGNQWYWSYSIEYVEDLYDSIMMDFIDSVDKPLRLETSKPYVLLVSSADVIHSFSLPSHNMKVDGIPGRVNELFFCSRRMGLFVGYCSELCGAGHAYMPIVLEVVKNRKLL